jgi:hypothetical protein
MRSFPIDVAGTPKAVAAPARHGRHRGAGRERLNDLELQSLAMNDLPNFDPIAVVDEIAALETEAAAPRFGTLPHTRESRVAFRRAAPGTYRSPDGVRQERGYQVDQRVCGRRKASKGNGKECAYNDGYYSLWHLCSPYPPNSPLR